MSQNKTAARRRLEKLLRMAKSESTSQGERDAAQSIADQLMRATGLTEADAMDDESGQPYSVAGEGTPFPRSVWRKLLTNASAAVTGCVVWFEGDMITVLGTVHQRESFWAIHDWLCRQVNRLARFCVDDDVKDKKCWRHGYRIGLANGIAVRARELAALRGQQRRQAMTGTELELIDQIQAEIDRQTPKNLIDKMPASNYNRMAALIGSRDAKSVDLQRSVAVGKSRLLASGSEP